VAKAAPHPPSPASPPTWPPWWPPTCRAAASRWRACTGWSTGARRRADPRGPSAGGCRTASLP